MFLMSAWICSVLSGIPSPICLGSVSPSPYKVARRKSPPQYQQHDTTCNKWMSLSFRGLRMAQKKTIGISIIFHKEETWRL